MKNMQLPEDFIWLINYLFDVVLGNPNNSIVTEDINLLLGRAPKTFREFAEESAALGIWNEQEITI